ncbi:tRNA (uridine(54)-C5)-methyltransferase TrmA [Photobacterium phosphoreum]|uniref:tRNA/tmRNA (uracil-C(5))-methyltransferase n=1 Tax=Photobacterium phosphoreum TaxID=659 RepID=A0AAW4ZY11_PHOPO|nr:tRNA (uridine(54)-C5)-methyltransferase TrmA [Photobacterium phosphoreum]MCD9480247.1 tRNA (uridine(54)-C5)-methyltransferase TrmA [Photobacterium phosphoreum]MCD9484629.1 tRNA (uridine(54)-C5)-methyltransferase TrmA [Photobacterium phosphoreum]MCD9491995.1 tRNA (uridine(54)-C5)-methyltransferase TrmA [Photobacterium phosphoreum]MCD9507766.1 tRNA (uridine(54)-C5)-methyltransferase TrmA [Photobacterium phosphoreum]MCD9520139.1 tRNA (uridine(54)-C5)-methyltransferase TrmA [Photobacterium phos
MTSTVLNTADYQPQLDEKAARIQDLLSDFETPELEVFASPAEHYRMRAEFRVWHEGEELYYIMFNQHTREKYRVDQFPAASRLINDVMPMLLEAIKPIKALRHKLFQVDFLSTLSGEILVSMLYHRQLDDEWTEAAKKLKQRLNDEGFKLNLIGRARKMKIVLDQDYVIEQLKVHDKALTYKQVENSFTQPNGEVAQKMLEWAVDCTQDSAGDLLELYCGNGNFSLALAPNFERVLATELAKPSVDSAQYNIAVNNIENVQIIRMSAEDFTDAMAGKREFRRLKDQNVDLQSYNCNTIFVDPPRSGMDDGTCRMVQGYDNIMYISCNPETLRDNLAILTETHHITRFALFDQFPYTHHMEAGVLLERK